MRTLETDMSGCPFIWLEATTPTLLEHHAHAEGYSESLLQPVGSLQRSCRAEHGAVAEWESQKSSVGSTVFMGVETRLSYPKQAIWALS